MISKTNVWNKTRSRQLHLNSNLNIMYSKEEGTRSFSYIKSITFICYSNVVLPTTCFILYQRNCQWMEKFQHVSKQYIFPGQIYKKNIFLSPYEIEIKEIVCLHFIDYSNQFLESIWNLMGSEHHKTSKRIHSFVRSQGWIDNIQGRQLFILDVSGDYSYLNDVIKDINLQFLYHKAFKWIPW